MTPDLRTPVSVITGFLGSGKTTLLAAALRDPRAADSMVVVNEFGEVGLDHHLLATSEDRTLLLGNGCLCCRLRGDLQELLMDLFLQRQRGTLPGFARVLVETSGLADPGPILATFHGDTGVSREFRVAGVLAVADVTTMPATLAAHPLARRQVLLADRIVLSKVDRATPDQLSLAEAALRAAGARAPIVQAARGELDALQVIEPGLIGREATASNEGAYLGRFASAHVDGAESCFLPLPDAVPRAAFDAFLAALTRLQGERLLRVKGLVRFEGEAQPLVVQGVGHVFERPVPLPRLLAAAPPATGLTFITLVVSAAAITALWQATLALSR